MTELRLSTVAYGTEGRRALVLDGLYRSPEDVRRAALAQPFERRTEYPGLWGTASPDLPGLKTLLAPILQTSCAALHCESFYALMFGPTSWPHVDPFNVAGVIYLTPDEHVAGGTAFFRHRETGVESAEFREGRISLERHARRLGFLGQRELAQRLRCPPSGWSVVGLVPMRFNRCVLYDPSSFHGACFEEGAFGHLPETGRLTQNIFVRY